MERVARNLSDKPGARPGRAHIVGPRSTRGLARLLAALSPPHVVDASVPRIVDAALVLPGWWGDGSLRLWCAVVGWF
jgi:hypothetical protein